MREFKQSANVVNESHRMLAYNAKQINVSLGEGISQSDGVSWYFGILAHDIKKLIYRVEDCPEAHALETPARWYEMARGHADEAAAAAAKLMGVKNEHAQSLIDLTAEAVKASRDWIDVTDPSLFIPDSVIEHLQLAVSGLEEAIAAAKAKGQAIQDQAEDLARRANEAYENFVF